jgi:type IV secretory pathway VirB10-like protein
MKDNWYPIQNIFVHGGTFTVKTIAGQIALTANTRVLWIAQKGNEESAAIEASGTVAKDGTDLPTPAPRERTLQTPPPPPNAAIHPPTPNAAIGTTPQPIDRSTNPPGMPLGESIAIAELQRHLQHQKHATAAAERRAMKAEQRANIAEERLEIVYRYLRQIGVEPSQLYRDGQFTIEE